MIDHVYLKSILYRSGTHYAVYENACNSSNGVAPFDIKLGKLLGSFCIDRNKIVSGFAKITKGFYLLAAYGRVIVIPKSDVIRLNPQSIDRVPLGYFLSTEEYTPIEKAREPKSNIEIKYNPAIKIDYKGYEDTVIPLGKPEVCCIKLDSKVNRGMVYGEGVVYDTPDATLTLIERGAFDYWSVKFKDTPTEVKGTMTRRISTEKPNCTSPRLVFTPIKDTSELVVDMFDRETEDRIVRILKPEKAWELDVVWQKTNGDCYTEIAPLVAEKIRKHRIGKYQQFNPALLERGELVEDGIKREITQYNGVTVGWVTTRRSWCTGNLIATYHVIDDQFRKEIKERHRRISKALHTVRQEERNGLYEKYEVKNKKTGEVVKNTFTLRPGLDPHANVALRAYAESVKTENPVLYGDLMTLLG